jgi:two-component system response regulator DesR
VLTVDDDAATRKAMRALIAATTGFVSVGEVGSGEEALEAVRELEPDLAIVDVEMPGLDGYETSRMLTAARPATVVILVSSGDSADATPKATLTPPVLRDLWEVRSLD